MFAYIKGVVEEIAQDSIVLDHDGIGYFIYVPTTVLSQLPGKGVEVKIHTYFQVKEDGFSLFGFLSKEELELFKLLISVNGIGPKAGISILSVLSAEDLRFAIASEDDKAIAQAPGVGKKTAQRVIIDLKDKIDFVGAVESKLDAGEKNAISGARNDAILALSSLGYSQTESYKAVAEIENADEMDVESIIKEALKKLTFM
ncbi:Holliday junction DNA helicase subunit RuvA [Lachnospiraceae bacterium A10]|jgi:Holliday junction DNA helicase RuvA|nr:Holliday junction DNA helicase subunit RuvA [Lachnospiraceae bacterium A10]